MPFEPPASDRWVPPAGDRQRPIGEMSPEEIEALDPREHGGVERVPFLDDPVLGALAGTILMASPAILAAKAAGRAIPPLLKWGGAGGAGAYLYDQLKGD